MNEELRNMAAGFAESLITGEGATIGPTRLKVIGDMALQLAKQIIDATPQDRPANIPEWAEG